MAGRVVETTGRTLTTLKHSVGDTVETLVDDVTSFVAQVTVTRDQKENVTGCLITCETNDLRFAWGVNPTGSGGANLGHVLAAGQSIKLTNHKQIIDFRFCNKTAGSAAVIHITPETSKV